MKYILYVYVSGFVSLNAVVLILMQLRFYYKRFKRHVKTFETKPTPKPESIVPAQVPIILQMPPQIPETPAVPAEDIVERRIDITDLKTEPTVI